MNMKTMLKSFFVCFTERNVYINLLKCIIYCRALTDYIYDEMSNE